jgi:prepilin-type N-terminal cleavage/methylation domain-containing protein
MRHHHAGGFSLLEIAIVLVIVSILLATVALPLAGQIDARRTEDTRRQLDAVSDALIGFALANGRLPCASEIGDNGTESLAANDGTCRAYNGFLPAVTLGMTPVDTNGFMRDAWGLSRNRIRYAVADVTVTSSTGVCPLISHIFTKTDGMKTAGMSCLATYNTDTSSPPKTLLTVCSATPASTQPFCSANKLTISAPFVLIAPGKNAATGGVAIDEAINSNSTSKAFVSRLPSQAGAPGGEFDDIVTWGSLNTLFAKMVQAGKLP